MPILVCGPMSFATALVRKQIAPTGDPKGMDAFLANAILFIHAAYVTFTVGGEVTILVGAAFRWRWVRNIAFRVVHAAAVVLVALEAIVGVSCPLTIWEYQLRLLAHEQVEAQVPFVARILRSIIFYDFPAWVFLAAYVAFAVIVAVTLLFIPPLGRGPRRPAPPKHPERRM